MATSPDFMGTAPVHAPVGDMAAAGLVGPFAIARWQCIGMGGKHEGGFGAALDPRDDVEPAGGEFFDLGGKAQIAQGAGEGLCDARLIAGGIGAFAADQGGQQLCCRIGCQARPVGCLGHLFRERPRGGEVKAAKRPRGARQGCVFGVANYGLASRYVSVRP